MDKYSQLEECWTVKLTATLFQEEIVLVKGVHLKEENTAETRLAQW